MSATDRYLADLRAWFGGIDSAVVAYSGGVDSTLVLALATRELGPRALGVLGLSPSVAVAEREQARATAAAFGARLAEIQTHELDDPLYVANAPDRCFACKSELYHVLRRVAVAHEFVALLNGTNLDDLGDWRPGISAGEQAGVRSPLLECRLGKSEVRELARHLGLPNWDKPAQPCLASRLPYGTEVTAERLAAVEAVELHLRGLGFRDVRARHHGRIVRLEVERSRLDDLVARQDDPQLLEAVLRAGFAAFEIEAGAFLSGRLNAVLGTGRA